MIEVMDIYDLVLSRTIEIAILGFLAYILAKLVMDIFDENIMK